MFEALPPVCKPNWRTTSSPGSEACGSLAQNDIMKANLKPQLIAIDGPVAVGKSSVGLRLAKRLGYIFFDTGMIYRAFTWKVLKSGISPQGSDKQKLCELANTTEFDFIASKEGALSVVVDGEDVSSRLLRPEIEELVALVAKVAGVRQVMVSQQRKLAQRGKVVMAGRDIGTVVLPWAELKIFLTASTEERAKRRHRELLNRGENSSLEIVLADLKKRDEMDINRSISPLKPAEDAIIINTENISLEQVVDKICTLAAHP
jgi:cytidylate kinase